MGKIKDRIDNLSYGMRLALLIGSTSALLSGTASGCYAGFKYFAKSSRVAKLEVRLDKKDLEGRIEFLEKQYYNCKDRHGNDFSKIPDLWDRENCRKWRKELELKYDEQKQYYKG